MSWLSSNFVTYILLRPDANLAKVESRLQPFFVKHAEPELQAVLHSSFKQLEQSGDYVRVNLIPLKDIHLHSNRVAELGANGNIEFVYIFSAIAAFILLIACVNFMNLSTARSSNRAKEVGVRKVLGSARKQLVIQFLIESVMVTLVAAAIAVFIACALLPIFNQLSGKELSVTPQLLRGFVPVLIVLVLVIGCLAGSYPALFLSGFQPIEVLKGKLASGFKGGLLRSSLVVFQFSISIFLIIGTLVIYNQLRYIQNKDIGYNREHILMVNDAWALGGAAYTLKTELQQLAGVESVSLADAVPTWNYGNQTTFFKSRALVLDQKQALNTQLWGVDEDYIPTLGMKIEAGRNFSLGRMADSSAVIINEAAAKRLGFANPLDKIIYKPMDNGLKVLKPLHIIGVVKDFNFRSLRENVTSLVFTLNHSNTACAVRIKSTDIPGLLARIKEKWNTVSPHHEFSYSFMEQDFDSMYRAEQQTGKIAISFTTMAIIIACLGLFGLAAYAAEQRTKEIGIRKVLGAGVSTIVNMLSMDFIKLVLIAIFIATPLAWSGMQLWLKGFVYKQDIQWWVPAVAGLAVIIIAFATISFQSIKAALTNPVKSLKSE
jgi:putative ABC transport system permease protein